MDRPTHRRVAALSGTLSAILLACSPSTSDSRSTATPSSSSAVETSPAVEPVTSTPPDAPPAPAAPHAPIEASARITAADVFDHEHEWPDIVALVEPYTPPGADAPLKKGYRGALLRVDEQGRARIAFGRHGNHDIPIERTDLVPRANEVAAGTRHKLGPNFLVHFGAQFLDPVPDPPRPIPTAQLAQSNRFLCVFADPRAPGFKDLTRSLADLRAVPDLQLLLFPLATGPDELMIVREKLKEAGWTDPIGYPGAAEGHARALLGAIPGSPRALLVSAEGRLLALTELGTKAATERLRDAAMP